MGRTKIVATVGPSCETEEMLARMLEAGTDVFRLNMSHGSHAWHGRAAQAIRAAGRRTSRNVAILCDLCGPKIRVGRVSGEPLTLDGGQRVVLTAGAGGRGKIPVNYAGLAKEIKVGHPVLLDDGNLELVVRKVRSDDIDCEVVRGGQLLSNKGLNLPKTRLGVESFTDKDKADMAWGLKHGADWFALSFVRRAGDIVKARRHMKSLKGDVRILAKIEKQEAVEDIDAILDASDGVMVARGDLGVEIPLEQVPLVQKRIIELCNLQGKPVVTATQMLDSMVRSPRPTRAEVTDVANAVFDGTDALMLSAESASGPYPVEAVAMMNSIAEAAEANERYGALRRLREFLHRDNLHEAIADSVAHMAEGLQLQAILCLTESGSTARLVARGRPRCPILAYTPHEHVAHELALTWGIQAVAEPEKADVQDRPQHYEILFRRAVDLFVERGMLTRGRRIVVTAGIPLHVPGTTNILRVIDV